MILNSRMLKGEIYKYNRDPKLKVDLTLQTFNNIIANSFLAHMKNNLEKNRSDAIYDSPLKETTVDGSTKVKQS